MTLYNWLVRVSTIGFPMSSALSSPRQMSHTETKQDLFFLVHPDVLFSVPKIRICIRECLNPLEGQPFFFMPQEEGALWQSWGTSCLRWLWGHSAHLLHSHGKRKERRKSVIRECLKESTQELHKLNVKVNKEEHPMLRISNESSSKLWKWAHSTAKSQLACFHHCINRGENSFTFLLVWNTEVLVKYLDNLNIETTFLFKSCCYFEQQLLPSPSNATVSSSRAATKWVAGSAKKKTTNETI